MGFEWAEGTLFFTRGEVRAAKVKGYATPADFCDLFKGEMSRFYFLALLLTADANAAEKCFAAALESSQTGSVFSEWAPRWATHNIIKEAIRMIAPVQSTNPQENVHVGWNGSELQTMAAMITTVPALDRFVYVMSVLENYSDRECASFLGCAPADVKPARERAILQLSRMADHLAQECKLRASA
jgi:hypothetical protein